jgi:hypothetical protein
LEYGLYEAARVLGELLPYDCVEDGATGFLARTLEQFAVQLHRLVETELSRIAAQ